MPATKPTTEATQKAIPAEFKSVMDLLDRPVENWIPSKSGDQVYGYVVTVGQIKTKFGDYLLTEHDCGEPTLQRVAWMGVVLDNAAKIHNPRVGDMVAIRCLGPRERKDKDSVPPDYNDYLDFRVIVQSPMRGDDEND